MKVAAPGTAVAVSKAGVDVKAPGTVVEVKPGERGTGRSPAVTAAPSAFADQARVLHEAHSVCCVRQGAVYARTTQ